MATSKIDDPLANEALTKFKSIYSCEATVVTSAPGRVNLIGEHIDYNDGYVLPMALNMSTVLVGAISSNTKQCRLTTTTLQISESDRNVTINAEELISGNSPTPGPSGSWYNYVLGVIDQVLKQCSSIKAIPAFDVLIHTNVPLGGGLSSSASLEVSTLKFLIAICPELRNDSAITDLKQQALLCQAAEHTYPKMPCGIMDQFVSLMGKKGNAIMIDCRAPYNTRVVPIQDPNLVILVTDTQVKHELAGSEYSVRRQQCESAVAKLGKASLRDVTLEELYANKDQLTPIEYKRALHVVTEIANTLSAAIALDNRDYSQFGKLMVASHHSLRDNYEVSCKELDELVELAMQCNGVYGSRMTGGGFGGCTVTLLKQEALEKVKKHLKDNYSKAICYSTIPSDGAQILMAP